MNESSNGVAAPQNGGLAVSMRGVTKVYQMGEVEVHALRGISLDFADGGFTVLLGPSGSGKSTLLNILGGLDRPDRRAGALSRPGPHEG